MNYKNRVIGELENDKDGSVDLEILKVARNTISVTPDGLLMRSVLNMDCLKLQTDTLEEDGIIEGEDTAIIMNGYECVACHESTVINFTRGQLLTMLAAMDAAK